MTSRMSTPTYISTGWLTCAHVVHADFPILVGGKHHRHRWVHSNLRIIRFEKSSVLFPHNNNNCSPSTRYLVDLCFSRVAAERVKVAVA